MRDRRKSKRKKVNIKATILLVLLMATTASAGIAMGDVGGFAVAHKLMLLEQAGNLEEARQQAQILRAHLIQQRDKQYWEAVAVLDDALDESVLADIYEKRREIAKKVNGVLKGAQIFIGSRTVK